MSWLALDVGGANLKAADSEGYAHSRPFSLWQAPHELAGRLRELIDAAPPTDRLVATMTGELADCFATKSEGVQAIVTALEQAADGRPLRVYRTDGRLVSTEEARGDPQSVAASNWHALARFAARFVGTKPGLLIDIGSTTCDIVPLVEGRPRPNGMTDTARLVCGELVYTGVDRSPVCALVRTLPYRGQMCRVAQELFATTGDVYRILGDLPEHAGGGATADGRPATRRASRRRLARCLCADAEDFCGEDAVEAAEAVASCQRELIAAAVRQVRQRMTADPTRVVLSGQGEFLARRVLASLAGDVESVSLGDMLTRAQSRCAAAHALAVLAAEASRR